MSLSCEILGLDKGILNGIATISWLLLSLNIIGFLSSEFPWLFGFCSTSIILCKISSNIPLTLSELFSNIIILLLSLVLLSLLLILLSGFIILTFLLLLILLFVLLLSTVD